MIPTCAYVVCRRLTRLLNAPSKDKEVISALSAARAGDYDRALAHLDASQELILTVVGIMSLYSALSRTAG